MRGGPYDLAVIGGGINGAGIARDAAGRGLKVVLLETERPRVRHVLGKLPSSSTAAFAISSTVLSGWCARR